MSHRVLSLICALALVACQNTQLSSAEPDASFDAQAASDADVAQATDAADASVAADASSDAGVGLGLPLIAVCFLDPDEVCKGDSCAREGAELRLLDPETGSTTLLLSLASELSILAQDGAAYDDVARRLYVGGVALDGVGRAYDRIVTIDVDAWSITNAVDTTAAEIVGIDRERALLATSGDEIRTVDPATGESSLRVAAEHLSPGRARVDANTDSLYVAGARRDPFFARYDLNDDALDFSAPVDAAFLEMHVDPHRGLVALQTAESDTFSLVRIDPATGASTLIAEDASPAVQPGCTAFDETYRHYYVLGRQTLSSFDVATGARQQVTVDAVCSDLFVLSPVLY